MPSFDYAAFLTQAAADARYQALGSLGSSTPSSIDPDDAGSAGVSTSASRQDHQHAATTGTPVAVGAANAEGAGTGLARDTHVHLGPGTLGYAEATANQGTFTAETDLTGLSVTVTVVSGRRIRITGWAYFKSSVATDTVDFRIKEGSTALQAAQLPMTSGFGLSTIVTKVLTPSPGSHTYKLAASRSTGSGNITMSVADFSITGQAAFILVEDIGV